MVPDPSRHTEGSSVKINERDSDFVKVIEELVGGEVSDNPKALDEHKVEEFVEEFAPFATLETHKTEKIHKRDSTVDQMDPLEMLEGLKCKF